MFSEGKQSNVVVGGMERLTLDLPNKYDAERDTIEENTVTSLRLQIRKIHTYVYKKRKGTVK